MKHLTFFLILFSLSFAQKVEIIADRFDSDAEKRISIFTGKVKITKGKDTLFSDKLTVYTDKANHPTKYVAIDNIKFSITSEDKSAVYTGKAGKLIYLPSDNIYELYTKVVIQEKKTNRTIRGDKVILNSDTGSAKVIGGKKEPIRITFELGTPSKDTNTTEGN